MIRNVPAEVSTYLPLSAGQLYEVPLEVAIGLTVLGEAVVEDGDDDAAGLDETLEEELEDELDSELDEELLELDSTEGTAQELT